MMRLLQKRWWSILCLMLAMMQYDDLFQNQSQSWHWQWQRAIVCTPKLPARKGAARRGPDDDDITMSSPAKQRTPEDIVTRKLTKNRNQQKGWAYSQLCKTKG